MSSKYRSILALTLLAGLCTASFAQPEHKRDMPKPAKPDMKQPEMQTPPGMPEMTPEMMQEMQVYMEAAQPGEMHKMLEKAVGTWDGTCKMWHAADEPPMDSKCTSSFVSLMDGRFVHGETEGDMMGMPFHGACIQGFDNVSKKFQMVWVDNMGTGMMTGTGELAKDQKSMTWTMKFNDPMTKKEVTYREKDTFMGDDQMKLEMWGPGKDGKEFKMMEIMYKRTADKATLPSDGTTDMHHDKPMNPHSPDMKKPAGH